MAIEDLPYTVTWNPTAPAWVPSQFTATGADGGAAHLTLIDQRKLPHDLEYLDCFTAKQVCDAIADLAVRGAPALGVSGAFAVVLWAKNEWPIEWAQKDAATKKVMLEREAFIPALKKVVKKVSNVRPTAVNLSWGAKQMLEFAQAGFAASATMPQIVEAIEHRAIEIAEEDKQMSIAIGENGARLLAELSKRKGRKLRVETHCNAGSLATVHRGTATAVIYKAFEEGLIEKVWVDETRPVDQGARLTAWEMGRAGVPYTLICDDMAGALMKKGEVDAVIVGADRICANGDVANKIGTYQLAVLAQFHEVPFFVAAPRTTFDYSLASGDQIEIEERDPREVRGILSRGSWVDVAPRNADVFNPAFDVTPHELITKIITEAASEDEGTAAADESGLAETA